VVLDALTQLWELITYSSDESVLASGFSGGQHIGDLVRLLGSPDPTVQLMTVRIITQVFDQVPPLMGLAVQAGVAEVSLGLRDVVLEGWWSGGGRARIDCLGYGARRSSVCLSCRGRR
jgi:hypothetical protein